MRVLFSVIFGLSFVCFTFAQELVTDRPDFTESALVVPARTIQVESGAERVTFNSVEERSLPVALARIGLGYRAEVRVGFSGWTTIEIHDLTETYVNDMILEAKYQLTQANATLPLAILLVSTLPTGDDEISAGDPEMGVKLAGAYDLNDRIGLGVNLGAISVKSNGDRQISSLASLAMGIGLSDQVSAFIEFFADIPENESWQPVVDGGFTVLLSPLMQLDAYVGKGLNEQAPEYILGAGFSFLFDYGS
jgi:hypothetical protein